MRLISLPTAARTGLDRRKVVSDTIAAEAQLQALEATFLAQLDGLARSFGGGPQPEAIAV